MENLGYFADEEKQNFNDKALDNRETSENN